jgi:iron complex outermembrane receptor protein
LKPEEAVTYEGGLKYTGKYLYGQMSVFRRDGSNIIDWIKTKPEDAKWQSMNLTKLNTYGFETTLNFLTDRIAGTSCPVKIFNLSYSFVETNKNSGDYISYYALDYLKHKFSAVLGHNITKNLTASWAYSYYYRAGTYLEYPSNAQKSYDPYSLLDGKISWHRELITAYIEASNILNKSFADIGNVEMPGRWIKAGLIVNFAF